MASHKTQKRDHTGIQDIGESRKIQTGSFKIQVVFCHTKEKIKKGTQKKKTPQGHTKL